jgi:predicted nucleotidyltransferase component of viral defense system
LSAHPDQHLFEAIAAELGVDPSFVEKDWHAMRLVALLAGIEHDPLRLVFSGGTSLSKGYNLIRRFSEDLDFKLVLPKGGVPRSVRSGYRRQVVQAIRATGNWTIEDTDIQVGNASQFLAVSSAIRTALPQPGFTTAGQARGNLFGAGLPS